jgi:hypothetical protein
VCIIIIIILPAVEVARRKLTFETQKPQHPSSPSTEVPLAMDDLDDLDDLRAAEEYFSSAAEGQGILLIHAGTQTDQSSPNSHTSSPATYEGKW